MQLSTSTSAPDSNPLPLSSTLVGSPAPGDAVPGAFADFLPAPVPAGASLSAAAPILPGVIPGGIAFTFATPVSVEAVADIVAPTSTPTPVDVSAKTSVCASGATSAAVLPSEETHAFSDSFQLLSTSSRPARTLPLAAPTLRSTRALPRADAAPTENIAVPPALALSPTETVIALPLDFVAASPALEKTRDLLAADEMPARPPAARNPWILPATSQIKTALVETPTSIPARDSASAQEIATFSDAGAMSAPPTDPALVNVRIDSRVAAKESRLRVSAVFASELGPEAAALETTPAVASGLSNEFAPKISSRIAVPLSGNRPAPSAVSCAENFAAAESEIFTAPISTSSFLNKNFLKTEDDEVTQVASGLGITVANSSVIMTAAPTLPPSAATPAAVCDANVANVLVAHPAAPPSAPAATSAEITAAAHRAVDAVLASTERLTSGTQSSVNLKFSVGGADLEVRVEVRAGAG